MERAQAIARRYSQAVCGRAPDSEDAVQEALLRTFRHAKQIREPRAFRAWLYRTVKNACLIGRRRPAGAPSRVHSLEDALVAGAEPREGSPTADQVVMTGQTREAVRSALASLPPAYREAVFLRDFETLSTREVARVLGISEANVKVRLHRAHVRLRAHLGRDDGHATSPGAKGSPSRRRRIP